MKIEIPEFRVRCRESERGWGSKTEYLAAETQEDAWRIFDDNQPKTNVVPDYYFISESVERFDESIMQWVPSERPKPKHSKKEETLQERQKKIVDRVRNEVSPDLANIIELLFHRGQSPEQVMKKLEDIRNLIQ